MAPPPPQKAAQTAPVTFNPHQKARRAPPTSLPPVDFSKKLQVVRSPSDLLLLSARQVGDAAGPGTVAPVTVSKATTSGEATAVPPTPPPHRNVRSQSGARPAAAPSGEPTSTPIAGGAAGLLKPLRSPAAVVPALVNRTNIHVPEWVLVEPAEHSRVEPATTPQVRRKPSAGDAVAPVKSDDTTGELETAVGTPEPPPGSPSWFGSRLHDQIAAIPGDSKAVQVGGDKFPAVRVPVELVADFVMIFGLPRLAPSSDSYPRSAVYIRHPPHNGKWCGGVKVFGTPGIQYFCRLEDYIFLVQLICRIASNLGRKLTLNQLVQLLSQSVQPRNNPDFDTRGDAGGPQGGRESEGSSVEELGGYLCGATESPVNAVLAEVERLLLVSAPTSHRAADDPVSSARTACVASIPGLKSPCTPDLLRFARIANILRRGDPSVLQLLKVPVQEEHPQRRSVALLDVVLNSQVTVAPLDSRAAAGTQLQSQSSDCSTSSPALIHRLLHQGGSSGILYGLNNSNLPSALTKMTINQLFDYRRTMGPFVTDEVYCFLVNLFEVLSGSRDPIPSDTAFVEARAALGYITPANGVLRAIYDDWRARRRAFGKPLLREFWPVPAANESNPLAVFRSRIKEKMVLRRPRRNAAGRSGRLDRLAEEFLCTEHLFGASRIRDLLKLHLCDLDSILFEQLWKQSKDPEYYYPIWPQLKRQQFLPQVLALAEHSPRILRDVVLGLDVRMHVQLSQDGSVRLVPSGITENAQEDLWRDSRDSRESCCDATVPEAALRVAYRKVVFPSWQAPRPYPTAPPMAAPDVTMQDSNGWSSDDWATLQSSNPLWVTQQALEASFAAYYTALGLQHCTMASVLQSQNCSTTKKPSDEGSGAAGGFFHRNPLRVSFRTGRCSNRLWVDRFYINSQQPVIEVSGSYYAASQLHRHSSRECRRGARDRRSHSDPSCRRRHHHHHHSRHRQHHSHHRHQQHEHNAAAEGVAGEDTAEQSSRQQSRKGLPLQLSVMVRESSDSPSLEFHDESGLTAGSSSSDEGVVVVEDGDEDSGGPITSNVVPAVNDTAAAATTNRTIAGSAVPSQEADTEAATATAAPPLSR